MEESEDLETSVSKMDDVGIVDETKEHVTDEHEGKGHASDDSGSKGHDSDEDESKENGSDEGEDDAANDSGFPKPTMGAKDTNVVGKRSDVELDYDPLEVARQVAIEVEREVEDDREPSCSSSEKTVGGRLRQSDSPDSTNGKQSEPIEGPPNQVPTRSDQSAETSPMGGEPLVCTEMQGSEPEKCIQDMESLQVTEAAQEAEANTNKGICSEVIDHLVNPISTPISVVSASKAEAAPGLPVAPLQFEGTLGWKGSAATSAFRRASPRRTPEGEKTLSTVETSNNSKQRQDYLDIDLNVAEGDDDKMMDLVPGKHISFLSGLPSRESSVDASPARSEKLKWDLNRVSDDGDTPKDWRLEGRLHYLNGHHSPSPSSSSSSMHPALRNIDLNDQPSFFDDSLDHPFLGKSSLSVNASGGHKSGDSVISIMGTRVEVNRKDTVSQKLPFPNGRILESAMDFNLGRAGGVLGMGSAVPYAHSSVYGYNGVTSGPNVPFSSTMYGAGGPIPYMVDLRGSPVTPQFLGSASALPPAFSQPPIMMTMAGTSSSNGAGSSRHNFDLNSGLMIDGGNNNYMGFRQLFNPDQSRSLDEHLRLNSQPVSGIGVRRKEPDGGFEPYPFNYKHHQPPWK